MPDELEGELLDLIKEARATGHCYEYLVCTDKPETGKASLERPSLEGRGAQNTRAHRFL